MPTLAVQHLSQWRWNCDDVCAATLLEAIQAVVFLLSRRLWLGAGALPELRRRSSRSI